MGLVRDPGTASRPPFYRFRFIYFPASWGPSLRLQVVAHTDKRTPNTEHNDADGTGGRKSLLATAGPPLPASRPRRKTTPPHSTPPPHGPVVLPDPAPVHDGLSELSGMTTDEVVQAVTCPICLVRLC